MSNEQNEEVFNRDFMANFTHQLIGPLQSIEGNCQNIVEKVIPHERVDKTIRAIAAQAKECIDLVRNMAMIASILSADEKILVEDMYGTTLASLLIGLAQNYEVLAQRKKCKVVLIGRSEINEFPRVAVNRELLRQAVGNLLDNAVKYCSEGTKIEISAKKVLDEQSIYLYVSNKGIGIPENERELIFKAGYRASNATKVIGTGTGAGLWLAREMMRRTGGDVHCDNISKESTRFRLTLPRVIRKVADL